MSGPERTQAIDFRRVFETSQDSYALLAPDPPDFTILAVSDGGVRMAMYPREAMVGRPFFEVFPDTPHDPNGRGQATLRENFQGALRNRRMQTLGTLRYDVPDPGHPGHFLERYWSPRIKPVLGDDGGTRYLLLRVEEVTDLVLGERMRPPPPEGDSAEPRRLVIAEADRDRRRYLEGLFATQWRVTTASSAAEALGAIDEDPPDLLLTAGELPDESGVALVRRLRERHTAAALPVILVLETAHPGEFHEAFRAGANEVIGNQAPARELAARAEAQAAEAELLRRLPEQASEHLRQLFMQAPMGIALMEGPEHIITLSNPAHDAIAGHRPLLNLPVREAFPEPGLQTFYDRLDEVYATGEAFTAQEMPVERQVPGTGEPFRKYVSVAYLPVRNFNGAIAGIATFVHDVTREVEARRAIERETERKDAFLSLLSHELRNPLTPIANAAQLLELQQGPLDPDQLARITATLSRQVTHLTRLVDDLLDLSRIDRGHITLQEEVVDLRDLVGHALESVPSLQEAEAFDFATALPDNPLPVHGDPVRLTQVITNLLDNAAKYTPRGGWIRLEAGRDGDDIVLSVRDNGAGIEPELLPELFEDFRRGPNRDTQTMGLGLGLTLARRLVALHGGRMGATSPGPGQGATFTVRLPTAPEPPATATGPPGTAESSPGQVLLVEDNEDVAGSMRFLLETVGQEVIHAPSGREALEAARSEPPSVVLIDIGLPDMDGFEVAGRLRQVLGDTPLVALSGHPPSQFPDQPTGVFDDYLLKPPTLEALKHALDLQPQA